MMESSMEMEFLQKYLAADYQVVGYSVNGDTHHVLLRSSDEIKALSFRTEDKAQNGHAEVTGFEEAELVLKV